MTRALTSLLFLVVLLFTACGQADKDNGAKKRPDKQQVVTTAQVTSGQHEQSIERNGNLRVRRIIHLHNFEEGQVMEMPWYEGDAVSRGDLLVALDDELLLTQQNKANAQLEEAEQNLQRLERLIKTQAVSEDSLISARTEVAVARADSEELAVRLRRSRMHADFDGVVTERLAEPGDFVAKNTHLLTVIDPLSLVIEVQLSQLLLPSINKGDAVEIQIDALGQQWFPAKILRVHPTIDSQTGQGTVEIGFDILPEGVRAGQHANLRMTITSGEILLIPYSALQQNRDRNWVFVLEDGKAVERDIKTGEYWPGGIEVIDGLSSGESVITRGFLGLRNGSVVTVVNDDG